MGAPIKRSLPPVFSFSAPSLSWGAGRGRAAGLPALRACQQPGSGLASSMFPFIADADDKPWVPGPYEGVQLKILHRHEATGGVVVLRKFAAGHTIPAHTHPEANEWAWVLSGEWDEDGVVYAPGTLFFAPKGTRHGPHVARTEVVSVTVFDGPLTVA